MARPVKASKRTTPPPPKRSYDSSRRQAQARETQGLIALAARELFIEHGYVATSIRDIAEHAGVAVQTIYNLFDGKADIFKRVSDITVVGDDEPVALADRAELTALLGLSDPAEIIDRWCAISAGIFERFAPLIPTLHEAVAADPQIAASWRLNSKENRYAGMNQTIRRLEALTAIQDDITTTEATDIAWTILSFESYEALVLERGWTAPQFRAWAARTLRSTLLR